MSETKAWIVAIEKYGQREGSVPSEDPLDIQSPVATWALEFAEFLADTAGVPKRNIILNLSLAAREDYSVRLKKLAIQVNGATQAEVHASLEKLRGEPDDRLLVYWVGHGIRDDESRYLLCSDSRSPGNLIALTADSILRYFRSSGYPGIQIGFFDTCAQWFLKPTTLELREYDPVAPRQFYFFAASANEFAAANLRGPSFSTEVLKHLKTYGGVPTDPKAFFEELDQGFDDLHSIGVLQNRPFYLQYTNDSGDQWSSKTIQGVRLPIRQDSIYLYDRGSQTDVLEELISKRSDRRSRPLLFVVSGPDPEYHEAFHQRLSQVPLPKRLVGYGCKGSNPMRFILPAKASTDKQILLNQVKTSLEETMGTSLNSIVDRLPKGLTYFRTRLSVDGKLSSSSTTILKALFELLNSPSEFPDLPSGKALCIGISIEWESVGPTQKTLAKHFPQDLYTSLRFCVLPDLQSPRRKDAKNWTDLLETIQPGLLPPTKWDALGRMVAGLFVSTETMRMRDLCDQFTKRFY